MSGPGSGSPEGTSGAGISRGAGGRITSGAGAGTGSLGWGVGMVPRFAHGNATGLAFVPAAEGNTIERPTSRIPSDSSEAKPLVL